MSAFSDYSLAELEQLIGRLDSVEDLAVVIAELEREAQWFPFDYQQPPLGDWATWLFLGGGR